LSTHSCNTSYPELQHKRRLLVLCAPRGDAPSAQTGLLKGRQVAGLVCQRPGPDMRRTSRSSAFELWSAIRHCLRRGDLVHLSTRGLSAPHGKARLRQFGGASLAGGDATGKHRCYRNVIGRKCYRNALDLDATAAGLDEDATAAGSVKMLPRGRRMRQACLTRSRALPPRSSLPRVGVRLAPSTAAVNCQRYIQLPCIPSWLRCVSVVTATGARK
jgi:hypothetical protein